LPSTLDRTTEAEFQRRLRATLTKISSPAAILYLESIADQAPPDWNPTSWMDGLQANGAHRPPWAWLAPLAFIDAWKGTELLGDQDLIILGFRYDGEPAERLPINDRPQPWAAQGRRAVASATA
jgi:hypothetical protein